MFRYRAYGLGIRSEVPLAELPEDSTAPANVDIRRHEFDGPRLDPKQLRRFDVGDDEAYLAWSGLGRFHVAASGTIHAHPAPDAEAAVGSLMAGPIMAALLHLRDFTLLHGSAVARDGGATLFLGQKGAGKSTIAAAAVGLGFNLVTDDIIALRRDAGGCLTIQPGVPMLKLTAEAHHHFLPGSTTLSPVTSAPAKLRVRLPLVGNEPVPVRSILILDERSTIAMQSGLGRMDALQAILGNLYALKFGDHAIPARRSARLFEDCAALARTIPVRSVRMPDRLDQLQTAAFAAISEHYPA